MHHHHPTPQATSASAQIIPMHRGFALRTWQLDLVWESGARFSGRIQALTRDEAEDLASARMGETSSTLVRSDSRPMPLQSGFSDTLPTLDMSSALADMASALRRSEGMAEDLPPAAAPATSPAQPVSLLGRAATIVRTLDAPVGCTGSGCRQGRNVLACNCALLPRWSAAHRAAQSFEQQPQPQPQAHRAHATSWPEHLVADDRDIVYRLPLRRRDLIVATLAVALGAAAAVLWSMPGTWAG